MLKGFLTRDKDHTIKLWDIEPYKDTSNNKWTCKEETIHSKIMTKSSVNAFFGNINPQWSNITPKDVFLNINEEEA